MSEKTGRIKHDELIVALNAAGELEGLPAGCVESLLDRSELVGASLSVFLGVATTKLREARKKFEQAKVPS